MPGPVCSGINRATSKDSSTEHAPNRKGGPGMIALWGDKRNETLVKVPLLDMHMIYVDDKSKASFMFTSSVGLAMLDLAPFSEGSVSLSSTWNK